MTSGAGEGLATRADQDRALRLTNVSRETLARLERFAGLLREWQPRINLIGPATLPLLWTRHIADSLQLLVLAPHAKIWVDLGSGAGFPGLVIACALAHNPGARVHLVESNGKKAAFLRAAIQATAAPAIVHAVRIGDFVDNFAESADVVTARALFPLEELLRAAYPLLKKGAVGLFPKGQDVEAELTTATRYWKMDMILAPSLTDSAARIVVVQHVAPVSPDERVPQRRSTGRRRRHD